MRVVLAPDSFKESLSAVEAAAAMAAGVRAVHPEAECVLIPMADGGEGFTDTVAAATGASVHTAVVTGCLGEPVQATYAVDKRHRRAICEVASAVGLGLIPPEERDIMRADTRGVGELLLAICSHDIDEIVIGLGGSATSDGGAGLLRALGAKLTDETGAPIEPGPAGLARLAMADCSAIPRSLGSVRLRVACDVDNPLLGSRGAAAVFAPQKGADRQQVAQLEQALARWVEVLAAGSGLPELGPDAQQVARRAGAGAAGGLGFAFQLLGAQVEPGVELVADLVGLAEAIRGADLVLVGEGSLDGQTLAGKTPYGVARIAAAQGVPVIAFAGALGEGSEVLLAHGFTALVPIVAQVCDLAGALANGASNLALAVERSLRLVQIQLCSASDQM